MDDRPNESVRLTSWKEIAAHLRVSVRTAQRWASTESLPARRHRQSTQSSVFAYRSELDSWLAARPHLRAEAPPQSHSVAVLPFVNLNRDEDGEIFGDGLTEELINALTQVPGLQVVARTSVFRFKGTSEDVRAIGARLGARSVLEGSVRRFEDRLLITAQLIDAASGYHLWSNRFDTQLRDIASLQEEIARAIVDTLCVKAAERITRSGPVDFEAYALYLKGRHEWNKRTRKGWLTAVDCLERAVERAPDMGVAWAGLADCYLMGQLADEHVAETLSKGRAAARRALEIDDTLAQAHASLAFAAAQYDRHWKNADTGFRRALELNSSYAFGHIVYGATVLAPNGRLKEAMLHARRACELDPLSAVPVGARSACHLMMRQFPEAVSAAEEALQIDPCYPWAHRFLGEARLFQGQYELAENAFSQIEAPVLAAGYLGYCYARTGRQSEARRLLARLTAMHDPTMAVQAAILHLGLNEHDAALNRLSEGVEQPFAPDANWLKVEPIWDPLRPRQQFQNLLKHLGLDL